MSATEKPSNRNPWTTKFYDRSDGPGFERVVFFSDAVFAIAMTLMAVEIGVPELHDGTSNAEVWDQLGDKLPQFFAFGVAFAWVAIYWRANHAFTSTLRGMSSRYIIAVLVYLAFVAFLPFAAGLLGSYGGENAGAVTFFAVFASVVSLLEVVLLVVADRDDMFVSPLSRPFFRQCVVGSLTPLVGFVGSIPIALYVSPILAMVFWLVCGVALGMLVGKLMPASPPN